MDPQRLLDVIDDLDARLTETNRRLDRLENELTLVVEANRLAQAALIGEAKPARTNDFNDFDDEEA